MLVPTNGCHRISSAWFFSPSHLLNDSPSMSAAGAAGASGENVGLKVRLSANVTVVSPGSDPTVVLSIVVPAGLFNATMGVVVFASDGEEQARHSAAQAR